MIDKLDTRDVWKHLQNTAKPIILYGMGNGADMVIARLESLGVEFADIFASDKFVRGQFFHGKQVQKYADICQKYDDFIIVMTFGTHDAPTLELVKDLNAKHEFYSLTMPIVDNEVFTLNFVLENLPRFEKVYAMLADEKSKQSYINVLNFKITGKVDYLFECHSEKDEIYKNIFRLDKNEHFVDLGAYDGDTIAEFLEASGGEYNKITSFEPDAKNFKKLCAKTEDIQNLERHNLGAWDKKEVLYFAKKAGRNSRIDEQGIAVNFDSVDNIVQDQVTFLKMDIEGAEKNALAGAKSTILHDKPKLYICAYHRNEDFFVLPEFVMNLDLNYKIYFRQHIYVPAWESNFYCVF
ncbi:MAG: FkbM family methyltransferase [Clostridia bacterium]